MGVFSEPFGKSSFGEAVERFTLTNDRSLRVRLMTQGATVLSIEAPDRSGQLADVVLGHDTAAEYVEDTPYYGCIVGRFANRIRGGSFALDGRVFQLAINNGPNALHGGLRGFDKRIWSAEPLPNQNAVRLSYVSADGEEGYPGEVTVSVTYTLTDHNGLQIDYAATTTRPTPLNLTNHAYFNLAGHDAGSILDHRLVLFAETFLPSDPSGLPSGRILPVAGTPLDFRTPHTLGERIEADDLQLRQAKGYDHNFCLSPAPTGEAGLAARAEEPVSGRVLEVYTTEPGVQLYTGNFLHKSPPGKQGVRYGDRHAFCLETQHYPDSPNQPAFPDTILRPGRPFASRTVYVFSVLPG